jgi:hypothetical protein
MTGKTVNETWPNLAGQNSEYLFKQLMDFSTEKRKSMIMNVIANELTEQQMKEVSESYQQLGSEKYPLFLINCKFLVFNFEVYNTKRINLLSNLELHYQA